jgi:small subunit ribosomal protein S20
MLRVAILREDLKSGDRLDADVSAPGPLTNHGALYALYFTRRSGNSLQANRTISMANTKSAQKAARKMVRKTEINKSRRTRLKTEVRKVEEALSAGKKGDAVAALKAAEPILMRTAQKGIIHKKTASRKISRLAARVKALSA